MKIPALSPGNEYFTKFVGKKTNVSPDGIFTKN